MATYAWVKTQTFGANAFAFTPTNAGDTLVIYVYNSAGSGNGTCTGVSGSLSGAWTQVKATFNDSNGGFHSIFTKPNCTAGADTITLTFNGGGTPGTIAFWVSEFSGVSAAPNIIATPPAFNLQTNPGTGTDAITATGQSVTLPPGAAGAGFIGFSVSINGLNSTAGTGYVRRFQGNNGGAQLQVEDKRITSSGTNTATFTSTNGAADTYVSSNISITEPAVRPLQEKGSTGGSGSFVSLAFDNNVQGGSSVQVVVRALSSTSFAVQDSQSNNFVQLGSFLNDGGSGHTYGHFKFDNVGAGAENITVNCVPAGTSVSIWIREICDTSGCDTFAQQVQLGTSNNAADAITSGSVNPNFSPGLASGFTNITIANPPALSAGSGYTSDGSPWGAGTSISQHQRYIGSTAQASTTTASTTASTNAFSFLALFKELGSVAGKSLSGQTATFSEGPASRSVSYTPSASTITSSEGTISRATSLNLTGQTATFGEGNLLNSINVTGQTATFATGTITKFVSGNVTNSISGLSASFGQGNLSLSIGYLLDSNFIIMVGQTANFAMGTITAVVSPAITATTATFAEGSITAGATTGPSYSLVGQVATFSPGTISASLPGSVTTQLSGQTATFTQHDLAAPLIIIDALAGQSASFTEGIISFSTSGNIAFLLGAQTASFGEGLLTVAFPGGMPNVVGYLVQEATLILQQSGVLQPKKIGYFGTYPITYHWIRSPQPPSVVLAQSVAPGTSFTVNMPITLTLSEFPFSVSPGG